jgi:hypothetical protein
MGEGEGISPEYEPDFVLPLRDAIREDNWEEYAAQGFAVRPTIGSEKTLLTELSSAESTYGTGNVYTGDAFDYDAGKPLRHRPGEGIYISPAGLEYARQREAKIREQDQAAIQRERERWDAQHGSKRQEEDADPTTS